MSVKVFPLLLLAGSAATLIATMNRANAALPPDTVIDGVSLQAWSSDVDTLARTAWAENRAGGWLGMQSVCNAVMNRVAVAANNGGYWWGNTVTDICLKHSGNVYQFDCWRAGTANNAALQAVTTSDQQFRDALELATRAVAGNLPDITRGATHYYAPGVISEPYWARGQQALADIQGQLFYAVA
jgi:N-acetylmuramoyl-L-alanine amidase